MMNSDLDRITAPDYLADLAGLSIAEIRERRATCQTLENTASFVRRFVQGRLDLVAAAKANQAGGPVPSLNEVIVGPENFVADGDGDTRSTRPVTEFDAGAANMVWIDHLDEIVSPVDLASLHELEAEQLDQMIDALGSYEQQVSADRRKLHHVIDTLQGEIIERYRAGDANVESLLAESP